MIARRTYNEEPFDASAVSASGGGGGHWESAYDPVRLEKAYKMIDAEDAGARSALQAKEDTYTENFIEQLRALHDGAAAVAMYEEHKDEFTTRGLTKINNAMGLVYPGALTAAHKGVTTSNGVRSNSSPGYGNDKVGKKAEKYLRTVDNSLGTVEHPGPTFHFKKDHTVKTTMDKLYDLRDSLPDDDPRKYALATAIAIREEREQEIWHSLPDDFEYDEEYDYESGIDYGDDEEE